MSREAPKVTGLSPKVTGLSPKEGPPGTKITIRGENLGTSANDLLSVTICGIDCLMFSEWQSPHKILTRSGRCKGIGDVIITTKSGGRGSSTVQFKGYEELVGPTKDSAVWVNEDDYYAGGSRHRPSSPTLLYNTQDPLGLCVDDDLPQLGRKISDSLFRELFPEVNECANGQNFGNIASQDFIPAWYLLERHNNTSFDDLKRGLNSLRSKVNGQKTPNANSGPVTFLKTNVLPVIECLDALKALHLTVKKDKQDVGPDLTVKVDESIKKSMDSAHAIFDSVLARKDKADSTRNALNVLQRYRFLFNLPSSIDRSIQRADYDIVINDFSRAKSLFADSEVKVFKKVYVEVEQRIEKFRVMLQEKLKHSCCNNDARNIDDVKKLIRYLISLEVPGNPAWESLDRIKETLLSSMQKCSEKHIALMNKPVTIEPDSLNDSNEVGYSIEAPQPVQFVEELTTLFGQSFPDLIKLGQAYLNGDLYTKESTEQLRNKEEIFQNEMILKPLNNLCEQMRAAILPNSIKSNVNLKKWSYEIDESFVVWLPYCLRCVINCGNNLSKLELPSSINAMKSFQQFIFDLRVHSMVSLFNQASNEIKSLHLKENWDVQLDDMLGAQTQLPLLFESKVVESLQLVRETVLQTRNSDESDIFSQINVQGSMKQLAQVLLQSFIVALENTVMTPSNSPSTVPKQIPSEEDRTLIVLCNCMFTCNHVIPRLHESFEKYGYPDMSLVIKITQTKFREFENKLFDGYIEKKCDIVIGAIEPSMYLFGNEWYAIDAPPSDVSYFVKETIMNLIEIQSEVYQVAPPLVDKVMRFIVEAALEEIQRLYESVASRLTEGACIQALVDINAFENTFAFAGEQLTVSAKKILNHSKSSIPHLQHSNYNELIEKILTKFNQSLNLQLTCFKYEFEQSLLTV